MAFLLTNSQVSLLKSLPCTECEFNKVHGLTRNVLWDNDLVELDNYDGMSYVALSKNGRAFLDFNGVYRGDGFDTCIFGSLIWSNCWYNGCD